jgi:small subunit ribosomal protein S20
VANHASAVKAHRQSLLHRDRNRALRTRLRSARRTLRASIDQKDTAGAGAAMKDTVSLIDRMKSKGVVHRNAAARYKSRLQARLAASQKNA